MRGVGERERDRERIGAGLSRSSCGTTERKEGRFLVRARTRRGVVPVTLSPCSSFHRTCIDGGRHQPPIPHRSRPAPAILRRRLLGALARSVFPSKGDEAGEALLQGGRRIRRSGGRRRRGPPEAGDGLPLPVAGAPGSDAGSALRHGESPRPSPPPLLRPPGRPLLPERLRQLQGLPRHAPRRRRIHGGFDPAVVAALRAALRGAGHHHALRLPEAGDGRPAPAHGVHPERPQFPRPLHRPAPPQRPRPPRRLPRPLLPAVLAGEDQARPRERRRGGALPLLLPLHPQRAVPDGHCRQRRLRRGGRPPPGGADAGSGCRGRQGGGRSVVGSVRSRR